MAASVLLFPWVKLSVIKIDICYSDLFQVIENLHTCLCIEV